MYEILMDLHNSTRQWALKGHSNELYQRGGSACSALPLMPLRRFPKVRQFGKHAPGWQREPSQTGCISGEKSPAAEAAIGPKTGRNELCPWAAVKIQEVLRKINRRQKFTG